MVTFLLIVIGLAAALGVMVLGWAGWNFLAPVFGLPVLSILQFLVLTFMIQLFRGMMHISIKKETKK